MPKGCLLLKSRVNYLSYLLVKDESRRVLQRNVRLWNIDFF